MDILYRHKLKFLLEDVIRALKTMEICPCSPDVGDCLRCRNSDGTIKHPKQLHRKKNALKTQRRAQLYKNTKKSPRKTSRRK
jgi:hypothetical protein